MDLTSEMPKAYSTAARFGRACAVFLAAAYIASQFCVDFLTPEVRNGEPPPQSFSFRELATYVVALNLCLFVFVLVTSLLRTAAGRSISFVASSVFLSLLWISSKVSPQNGPLLDQILPQHLGLICLLTFGNLVTWIVVRIINSALPPLLTQEGSRSRIVFFVIAYCTTFLTSIFVSVVADQLMLLIATIAAGKAIFLRRYQWTQQLENASRIAGFACIGILSFDLMHRGLTAFTRPYVFPPLRHDALLIGFILLACLWAFERRALLPLFGMYIYGIGAAAASEIYSGGRLLGPPAAQDYWGSFHLWTIIGLLALQALLVAAYRVHIGLYVAYAAALCLVLAVNVDYWLVASLGSISIFALFGLLNLIIQFFIENSRDAIRVWRSTSWGDRLGIALRTAWIWLPAAALVAVGFSAKNQFEQEIQNAAYSKQLVLPRPSASGRSMRLDALYTVDVRRDEIGQKISERLAESERKGRHAAKELPGDIAKFLEEQRPPLIADGACRGVGFKVAGIRIRLETLCRMILGIVDRAIQGAFNKATKNINARVEKAASDANRGLDIYYDDLKAEISSETYSAARYVKTIINSVFAVLLALQVVSLLSLIAAVLQGLNTVACRVAFDIKRAETKDPNTFRLAEGSAEALMVQSLDYSTRDHQVSSTGTSNTWLNFASRKLDGSENGWYAYIFTKREGHDTYLRMRAPQKFSCIVNRLFALRYWLTWIDSRPENLIEPPRKHPPRASKAYRTLVAVRVVPGQKLVCRTRDLFAFTKNVRISSVYSTHVGVGLLGLGRFYTVVHAQAPGTIVLIGYGRVQPLDKGNQSSPDSFLVWDQRSEFSVAQELGIVGVWMTPPSLMVHNESSVLTDRKPVGLLAPVFNSWRLLRYLFLPM